MRQMFVSVSPRHQYPQYHTEHQQADNPTKPPLTERQETSKRTMSYFEPFIIPFSVGVVILFAVMWTKFISWISALPKSDKKLIIRNAVSKATFAALWEVFSECLLHRRISRVNPRLWYMHMSLAFGWFLLIVAGKIEGTLYLKSPVNPPYVDVFFRKYFPEAHIPFMGFIMDLLLLFILSGLFMAVLKRFKPSVYGMKKTTRHTAGDRIALSSLWAIFPLRLTAESFNSALYDSGSFLTGTIGNLFAFLFPEHLLQILNETSWWLYSTALGTFFVAIPLSRYLHIFAEIPLIFLRSFKIRAAAVPTTFTNLEIAACSRCGICIDPCQLGRNDIANDIQSVYSLRNIREKCNTVENSDNCLMCGRCENICPVGIELNTIRISQRYKFRKNDNPYNYRYIGNRDFSQGEGKTGYFAGCMTMLSTKIIQAMEKIFRQSGEEVWFADKDGGVCCGRPQKLAGNIDAANRMMELNKSLFIKHGITTLVTSCPICLKVFKEDYKLENIRVIHHTQYIHELVQKGVLKLKKDNRKIFTYHDPCELGRGSRIYEQPRAVLSLAGTLVEIDETRENSLCCGGSLANTRLSFENKNLISKTLTDRFEATGAQYLVTSCPLCKKTLSRTSNIPVIDIAEAVS